MRRTEARDGWIVLASVLLVCWPAAVGAQEPTVAPDGALNDLDELSTLPEDMPLSREELEELLRAELHESLAAPATEADREPVSLPDGADRTATRASTISAPTAEGSLTGMGESFQPNLSAGTGAASVPIALPPGRNGVSPPLSLTYDTAAGNGPVGIGWTLNGPACISRSSEMGLPRYVDRPAWHPEEDRFVYGSAELVPVDAAEALARFGGSIPAWLSGWPMYLAQEGGSVQRVFRSPDSRRWVVQSPAGGLLELGALAAGDGPAEMVEASVRSLATRSASGEGPVHTWCLTRSSDVHGSVIYYRYREHQGRRYLEDVHYVSPSSCGGAGTASARRSCAAPLSHYGARVRMVYESRPDVFESYRTGWRVATGLRVRRIEITAWNDQAAQRTLVRRYHLSYLPLEESFHSLLHEVRMEGRPSTYDATWLSWVFDGSVPESSLTDAIVGELAAPTRFAYHLPRGSFRAAEPEGLDGTVHTSPWSPPHSVDEARTELFDVNADGLADVVVMDPSRYRTASGGPAVGVFFNGFRGSDARPHHAGGFSDAVPMEVPGGLAEVMTFSNANILPMDADGDGRADLLHMPRTGEYGYFTPTRTVGHGSEVSPAQQGWQWTWVPSVGAETDARFDLGRDGRSIERVDVNGDGLFDVVRTTGTGIQTWLNMSLIPGGEGRFGQAHYDGSAWQISTEPTMSCALRAGTQVDFAGEETRLADMNGDGLTDIVLLRRGRVVYWPGRGRGVWGTGDAPCPAGTVAEGRHVSMATPAAGMDFDAFNTRLMDVDQDGAADLVQIRFDELDVWLNRGGATFSSVIRVEHTPATASFLSQIRIDDIDGTGTDDIVWGRAGSYRWLDLMGGHRPRVLVSTLGALGAESTIEYGSSVEDYLRDLRAAWDCDGAECERFVWSSASDTACDGLLQTRAGVCVQRSSGSPVVSTVVRGSCATDHGERVGIAPVRVCTRYAYHDGYYEGIEREFRGFGAADTWVVGDAAHPTPTSRTHFHQGRRPGAIATDRLAENPLEPLAGASFLSETFDDSGRYLGTTFTAYAIRTVLEGLDGRFVSFAYSTRADALSYDTNPFTATPGVTAALDAVRLEGPGGEDAEVVEQHALRIRNALRYAHVASTTDEVDDAGHVLRSTAHGRIRGEHGEPVPDERILSFREVEQLGGESGWLWATRRSWVEDPSLPGVRLGETYAEHDPTTGVVLRSHGYANLLGAPFEFTGDADSETLVQASQELVTSSSYDVWGQVTATCVGADISAGVDACLGYAELQRDSSFDHFAILERVAVGRDGTGDFAYLATSARSDRGLGVTLEVTDPTGAVHRVGYDGLGRATFAAGPSAGDCEGIEMPSSRIEYFPTTDPEGQPVSRMHTVTHLSCEDPTQVLETWAYVDGAGRTRATLSTGDDAHAWVRGGVTTFDALGRPQRAYQVDFFDAAMPTLAEVLALPTTPHVRTEYDSFGRATTVVGPDGARSLTIPHALSSDQCDPNDLTVGGPHAGTCTTSRTDGHGRAIDQVLRNRDPDTSALQYLRLFTEYRADGAALRVIRAETLDDQPRTLTSIVGDHQIERVFTYDTAGRRIAATDPDADSRDPAATAVNRTWRYLFNRLGELAAVRDPRGCGQNFYYDVGGRLIGEAYVGCGEAQSAGVTPTATVPAGSIGLDVLGAPVTVDVRTHFDAYPTWVAGDLAPPPGAASTLGRVTATEDRATRSVAAYDARGQAVWEARQIALLPEAAAIASTTASLAAVDEPQLAPVPLSYDEVHTYVAETEHDFAGRVVRRVAPTDPDWAFHGGVGPAPEMAGTMEFDRRGLPRRARLHIGAQVQDVVSHVGYTRDGLPHTRVYGDDAGGTRAPTTTHTVYDALRRPTLVETVRTPVGVGGGAPSLAQVSVLASQRFEYDPAGNLLGIEDLRPASEWPEGLRPRNTLLRHDALYRLVEIFHEYHRTDGTVGTDLAQDWRAARTAPTAEGPSHSEADPMRGAPAPMLATLPATRVQSVMYDYDWLGNMRDWSDDHASFYERSIGLQTSGDVTAGGRPTALELATNLGATAHTPDVTVDRGGWVELDYGVSGNVVGMLVHAQCRDADATTSCHDDPAASTAARRAALASRCACEREQLYGYRWDELNRLSEARRYDRDGAVGDFTLAARQRYRYDGANQRVIKEAAGAGPEAPRVALYVGAGLERRGVLLDSLAGEYAAAPGSESQYLIAGARVVWRDGSPDVLLDGDHRVTLALGDHLGSTAAVLDLRTGALLEAGTFYANGAREAWTAQTEVAVAPETVGFTGKEADEEVGLVYFGERYLLPHLGRWASPDPLQLHALGGGEALNNYHYVAGKAYQTTDPTGLCPEGECAENEARPTEAPGPSVSVFDANEIRAGAQSFFAGAVRQTDEVIDVVPARVTGFRRTWTDVITLAEESIHTALVDGNEVAYRVPAVQATVTNTEFVVNTLPADISTRTVDRFPRLSGALRGLGIGGSVWSTYSYINDDDRTFADHGNYWLGTASTVAGEASLAVGSKTVAGAALGSAGLVLGAAAFGLWAGQWYDDTTGLSYVLSGTRRVATGTRGNASNRVRGHIQRLSKRVPVMIEATATQASWYRSQRETLQAAREDNRRWLDQMEREIEDRDRALEVQHHCRMEGGCAPLQHGTRIAPQGP